MDKLRKCKKTKDASRISGSEVLEDTDIVAKIQYHQKMEFEYF